MEQQNQTNHKTKGESWYDKYHKHILIFPVVLFVITLVFLYIFTQQNGDFIHKDVSLTGGTSVTIFDKNVDGKAIAESLRIQFPDLQYRIISDFSTGAKHGFSVETTANSSEVVKSLESKLGYKLDDKNSSIEFSGAGLSSGFYKQLRMAMIIAFLGMAIVVFVIFRTFVPSFAIIICAFADIAMTIAVVNLMGMRVSSAGIVAFLMLIGYSVDTDILLTSRLLKNREGSVDHRLWEAFKTGMTMTLTAIASVGVALIVVYSFSETLKQIFGIILIGLIFDIMNTWITNASILRWYMGRKGLA